VHHTHTALPSQQVDPPQHSHTCQVRSRKHYSVRQRLAIEDAGQDSWTGASVQDSVTGHRISPRMGQGKHSSFSGRSLDDLSDGHTLGDLPDEHILDDSLAGRIPDGTMDEERNPGETMDGRIPDGRRVVGSGRGISSGGPSHVDSDSVIEGGCQGSYPSHYPVSHRTNPPHRIVGMPVAGTLSAGGVAVERWVVGRGLRGLVALDLRIGVLCVPFRRLSGLAGGLRGCSFGIRMRGVFVWVVREMVGFVVGAWFEMSRIAWTTNYPGQESRSHPIVDSNSGGIGQIVDLSLAQIDLSADSSLGRIGCRVSTGRESAVSLTQSSNPPEPQPKDPPHPPTPQI
jgi:hypothetical protein